MSKHHNPRVYVGPLTVELIIPIDRAVGIDPHITTLSIEFTRRKVDAVVISTWTSYDILDGNAHFEIPDLFRTDAVTFPKGFYDGSVFSGECVIGEIELIKAPGHYLIASDSVEDECKVKTDWIEPDCADEVAPVVECPPTGDDGCPTCYNQVIVAPLIDNLNYVDLDEDDIEE